MQKKKTFISAGSLRWHLYNTHSTKLQFHLTETLSVNVEKSYKTFVCPISDCGKPFATFDTFRTRPNVIQKLVSIDTKYYEKDDGEPAPAIRRKMVLPSFSYESGCHALKLETLSRSTLTAASLDSLPVALNIDHGALNETVTLFGIVNADDLQNAQLHLPWSSSTTTSPLTAVLQLHTDKTNIITKAKRLISMTLAIFFRFF
ncbi:hypothetical protein DM01DRAFT_1138531 [Hesseltinella vesiculosa]|uniref:Uncharacterized protein n=1 Tax=Hesseltinella vesiculosa TaxID=101127 RepID=A0A1X2G7X8_9FUNG|nr:hypothetical protein DM01DRAFT_1138531 [Hesseltinella vesiculosa]